jgi:hypothetical protein
MRRMGVMEKTNHRPKLEEARRRWGKARVYTGTPTPKQHNPTPTAPAAAVQIRRAA